MPRYRFTKGGLFGWVEVDEATVTAVHGRREDEATLQPTTETFATAALARKEANALIAKFRAQGYEPDEFSDTAAAKRARQGKASLADVAALEDLVAADPDDEDAWSVLEDKLLELEDPRGQLLMIARDGSGHDDELRAQFYPQLLGTQHAAYKRTMSNEQWRGGYLVDCTIEPEPAQMLDSFLTLPATRLLRSLRLTGLNCYRIIEIAARLPNVKSRPRSLVDVRLVTRGAAQRRAIPYDASALRAWPLRTLGTSTAEMPLRNVAAISTIQVLEAVEDSYAGLRALLTGTLPELWMLKLDVSDVLADAELADAISTLPAFAPKLSVLLLGTRRRSTVEVFDKTLGGKVPIALPGKLRD